MPRTKETEAALLKSADTELQVCLDRITNKKCVAIAAQQAAYFLSATRCEFTEEADQLRDIGTRLNKPATSARAYDSILRKLKDQVKAKGEQHLQHFSH
ncbi:MAG: hypothetical protein HC773_00965 [Scytonema sp. CRU_2_7]|nr:hypothetical protein [Scytonema sp. CRU_2_7]